MINVAPTAIPITKTEIIILLTSKEGGSYDIDSLRSFSFKLIIP